MVICFNSHISVANNGFFYDFFEFLLNLNLFIEEIRVLILVDLCVAAQLELSDIQNTFGDGSCFANADVMKHCTCLDGIKVFNENLIILHLAYG